MKKLSFAIESAQVQETEDNSNFAIVSLDFFSSGRNAHNLIISEETLMRTSERIKNCPLIWKYDYFTNDAYTHDKDQVPCGFVPESAEVKSRKLDDGRVMLSVNAYLWKRYTGKLLDFFKRDGLQKPISVEISVNATKKHDNGQLELLDFDYQGITILGSLIKPAIFGASAKIIAFEKERKNFYDDVIKEFSKTQQDKVFTKTKNLLWTQLITEEKERTMTKENQEETLEVEIVQEEFTETAEEPNEHVHVAEGEAFAKEESEDEPKDKEESAESENKETVMADDESDDESEDKEKEDKADEDEDEKEEYAKPEEEKEDESDDEKPKEEDKNFEALAVELQSQVEQLTMSLAKAEESSKALMAEIEALSKFKADIEASQKAFAVEQTIKEIEEKVVIPEEAREDMLKKADEYSFEQLEDWKQYCKAISFEFPVVESGEADVVRVGLPFYTTEKRKDSLWTSLRKSH